MNIYHVLVRRAEDRKEQWLSVKHADWPATRKYISQLKTIILLLQLVTNSNLLTKLRSRPQDPKLKNSSLQVENCSARKLLSNGNSFINKSLISWFKVKKWRNPKQHFVHGYLSLRRNGPLYSSMVLLLSARRKKHPAAKMEHEDGRPRPARM